MSSTTNPMQQLWRNHLQRSLVMHLAVLAGLLAYVVVTDALHDLWVIFSPKSPTVIGISFVDSVSSVSPKAPLPSATDVGQSAVLSKVKMPEMVKKSTGSTKPQLQPTVAESVNKKANSVQRQVSKVSKVTKTSMDRKVNLKQQASEKSNHSSPVGIKNVDKTLSKSSAATKSQISNAQQIAAKKVIATGKKIVETADVKKTKTQVVEKEGKKNTQVPHKTSAAQIQDQAQTLRHKSLSSEATKKAQEEAQKAKQAQLDAAREKKRLADLAQQRKQQQELGLIAQYSQMMVGHIQSHALFSAGMENRQVKLKVNIDLSGAVQSVLLINSSGEASFDRLAINAVYKASPLPLPEDASIAKRMTVINLTIKPDMLN